MKAELQAASDRFVGNVGTAMFALLPAYAGWLMLVFGRRPRRYTEHLVCALHLHAFWFFAMLLLLIPLPFLDGIVVLAAMAYPILALHRVYPMRWWSTFWRSALLAVLYGVTVLITMALVFVGRCSADVGFRPGQLVNGMPALTN